MNISVDSIEEIVHVKSNLSKIELKKKSLQISLILCNKGNKDYLDQLYILFKKLQYHICSTNALTLSATKNSSNDNDPLPSLSNCVNNSLHC